jgi:hypothetical protein
MVRKVHMRGPKHVKMEKMNFLGEWEGHTTSLKMEREK